MVASHLRLVIAAAVVSTAAGFSLNSLRHPFTRNADVEQGQAPVSMLDTGSGVDAGQKAPFSWLFGGPATAGNPAAPVQMSGQPAFPVAGMPVAAPVAPAAMPPVGIAAAPVLGLTPVAAAPAAAGMMPFNGPPPGAVPLSTLTGGLPGAAAPTAPAAPKNEPPAVAQHEVAQMRNEIATLREEVVSGNKDMWSAVKLITATVEKDENTMQALTQDVQTLRGRHGGSVPLVATECSMRQSSCGDCLSVPNCVWCKVEQKCFSGDSAGPVRGECAFFKYGTCDR